ncbi:hypothetical protein BU26DRAFT_313268 [Trematosphaeria pertusa]|uniref:Uncharacterized protein n=1 Tax=Trematosphaeria pertusa TaxID=390896 RepID=A0A6A6IHY2_9PLEO|nr:uncharacterized protein BU26DRAFT_313268 [Trematosphaeria pertusa]KAF2249163.1 hypothetical protein BU26DRAFT_313268 [Trematosphaeria pertusa]
MLRIEYELIFAASENESTYRLRRRISDPWEVCDEAKDLSPYSDLHTAPPPLLGHYYGSQRTVYRSLSTHEDPLRGLTKAPSRESAQISALRMGGREVCCCAGPPIRCQADGSPLDALDEGRQWRYSLQWHRGANVHLVRHVAFWLPGCCAATLLEPGATKMCPVELVQNVITRVLKGSAVLEDCFFLVVQKGVYLRWISTYVMWRSA